MELTLETTIRKQTPIRLALEGPSGSGKTYSALLLALGLCGDLSKVAVIDTQHRSAALYSHLGPFSTIHLGAPFYPARYYEAIDLCEASDKEVIILDTITEEWIGMGGVIDRLQGDQYEDTLRAHRAFLTAIRHSSAHIIATVRTRQKLVRMETKGTWCRRLVQLPLQQEGLEYLFTTVLRLDQHQKAHVVKDRTSLFTGKPAFRITEATGAQIHDWCLQGEPVISPELQQRINECRTPGELNQLLFSEEIEDVDVISFFTKRRLELEELTSGETSLGKRDTGVQLIRGGLL